mgnify:FL=1
MKTVLFGGTFDPPHLGHKMIIEELIKMDFDSILVLPNKKPDYKKVSATDRQRLDMLKIMTDKMGDKVKICNFELSQDVFTPTAKVIQFIKNSIKSDVVYFALGSDSFNAVSTWEDFDYLKENVHFIILDRGTVYKTEGLMHTVVDNDILRISSTELKVNMEEDKIDEDVLKYIKKRKLYGLRSY